MSTVQPRLLIALVVPILAALGLVVAEPDYKIPAVLMAFVSLGCLFAALPSAGLLTQPLERLLRAVRAVRSGSALQDPPDFAPVVEQRAFAELEKLNESLTQSSARLQAEQIRAAELQEQLRITSAQQGDHSTRFTEVIETLRVQELATEALRAGLGEQLQLSEQLHQYSQETSSALGEVVSRADMLVGSAEEGAAAIVQMNATNDRVARSIGELSASVRESVASIEEMTFSIKEVARNVDALSLTAEETSASMNQMDVSIDQVQSNANETARLSEEVARDAETGAEAILKTIGEIYRIRESSGEAVAVIANLGSKIDAIGQILNVIDEVAEQTNLLALNAAIIAAQAGEHGKGFAVVADEIKDLAERAGASTKEIADLIKTIQSESRNAIQAVERGAQNVDRGVQVSNDAERALKKILESSQKSTNMVRAIARATVEQAKGSRQVTDAIGRIAETVQQIAAATAEQARGSELIMTSGDKMRAIATQVERSSQEQSRGSRQVAGSIESISTLVQQLSPAYRQKVKAAEGALRVASALESGLKANRDAVTSASLALNRSRSRIQ